MTDCGGDRIQQLRQELAELRAEVERLSAEKGETKPEARRKRPKLRVIKGGLGGVAGAWVLEHWRAAATSVAVSMVAAGAVTWNYQIAPEQIDALEAKPKHTVATRTTVPAPRHPVAPAPPQDRQASRSTPTPRGTVPPAKTSKPPVKTSKPEPTRTPKPKGLLPKVRSVVPTAPGVTLPPRPLAKVRKQLPLPSLPLPTGGKCPQATVGVTVTVCVPIRR